MSLMLEDTIAAAATAPGQGGISIVRISGRDAEYVLRKIFRPAGHGGMRDHMLTYGRLIEADGETADECMAVLMRAPKTYTREDVAELHLHGGEFLTRRALEMCIDAGARLAEAGEFTRRAFLNGRIDLSRAEAVMRLITARDSQTHRAAVRQLEGGAASFIREAADELYRLQAGIAAAVDFPDEVTDEEAEDELLPRLEKLIRLLSSNADERAGRLTENGLTVALVGPPNAGKSSILNALIGEDRAIVTPVPGTTRDTLTGETTLGGARVVITDTAGLRKTDDAVEKLGVERSEKALAASDVAVLVIDGSRPVDDETEAMLERLPRGGCVLLNKSDLPFSSGAEALASGMSGNVCFRVSALRPDTLSSFREYLAEQAALSDRIALTHPRHIQAVRTAVRHLNDALRTLRVWSVDLAATDLQAAQDALAEVTGDRADEKLLDAVFSGFCVGK